MSDKQDCRFSIADCRLLKNDIADLRICPIAHAQSKIVNRQLLHYSPFTIHYS